ncbi:MAG: nucleotidyltransferase domain-containing protein, partial [Planctomycetes bacterium]|nr:nucleotidyltransferase domain-containing protein [Planctomycetota bacterium]
MSEAILAALRGIEHERAVRVLFAIESGSRAWGFASPDSDFDVRFVYVHPLDWYLRITAGDDQITRLLPGDLDVVGWELRKALRLFGSSNVAMLEHLGSSIVYRDDGVLLPQLRALVPAFFNAIAAAHHYLGLATRMHQEHLAGSEVNLKKLFYVLRPLAACRWIECHQTMPPTGFADVVAGIELSPQQRAWLDELWQQKVAAGEAQRAPLAADRRAWIDAWLQQSRD